MLTEFASLQMSRSELQEIHAALVRNALVEDRVRREKGLEAIERRPMLEQIEKLLGENEHSLHMLDHVAEDGLWEYSWYVFTDEWAWFRAEKETLLELGPKREAMDKAEFEKTVEIRYHKNFDRYVAEIDMVEEGKPSTKRVKQQKTS
jgi:hypothetical protein